MYNIHLNGKYLRRQRQKQLQTKVNFGVTEQVRIVLHSSDVHRPVQGVQLEPIVFELINDLRVIVLPLQIDASEKFNHVVHEMPDVANVLVQRGS